jgi:hypothetical protein
MGYAHSIERVIFMTVCGSKTPNQDYPVAAAISGPVGVRANGLRLDILLLISP